MNAPRTAVMANAGSALVVDHVSVKRADRVVVEDVTLDVKPLELHGLVGANGAGKTSLLEAIAGLVPSTGDVFLGGVPLDREQRAQHVFLAPDVVDERRVPFADDRARALLAFAAASLGARDDVSSVCSRLLLDDAVLDQKLRALSKGERKRVLVAMAMLVPQGFVLIDEPFDGLDGKEMRALANVLRTSTNEKRAVLCALHDAGAAEKLCDRFTILDHGKVKASAPIHELRAKANLHPGAPLDEVLLAFA